MDPAHRHAIFRFATGTTAAFVISEWMAWQPTFLASILTATLLASLPAALPLKGGLFLFLVQGAGAFAAFALSAFLHETPFVLFGAIGLILFLAFSSIAKGRGFLPILLILISFSSIPVVAIASPVAASGLPTAFARAMGLAVTIIWLMQAIWPVVASKRPSSAEVTKMDSVQLAIAGTAIVLPLMLLYLMYAITAALPVLITTVVLVVNFDPKRGALQGLAMVAGNLVGGIVAVTFRALLEVGPNLFALATVTFALAVLFGQRVEAGGPLGALSLVTFNQSIIMISLGLVPGSSSPALWMTRVLEFVIAYVFAVGMMYLLLPSTSSRRHSGPQSGEAV